MHVPPVAAPVDYQLGGAYPPADSIRIISRDLMDKPVHGLYSICYVNAFQTQPHQSRWWRQSHANLLLRDSRGRLVRDSQWNEVLFDISRHRKRVVLARIIGKWISGCARSGFQAVEPDNLDSWTRSRGRLRAAHAIAFARMLARKSHRVGLAIAQKNAADLSRLRARIGFDFAVSEECQAYRECDAYLRHYGRRVIEIEYSDNGGLSTFLAACAARGHTISVVYRDRNLRQPGQPGYAARWCT